MIGNGKIATVIHKQDIFVSGLYNGKSISTPSHRARIPSTMNRRIGDTITRVDRGLSVRHGQYFERYNSEIEISHFAHRKYPNLLVTNVKYLKSNHSNYKLKNDPGPIT